MNWIVKNPLAALFWLLVLGGVVNYFISSPSMTEAAKEQMKEAFVEYVKGEKASTIAERSEAFNQALKLYAQLQAEFHPKFGNGILDYNIANSYFQLGEYPLAILHYYRSLSLMPRNDKAAHNLKVALDKLGLKEEGKKSIFGKIFFFYSFLSLPEKLEAFFGLSLLSLLSASMFIWQGRNWMKRTALTCAFFASILLLCIGYHLYYEPTEGVIVKATALYRDAGFQYAKVVEEPVLSGKKVRVVEVLGEGQWLKIVTPEGALGYIPSESVRII